MLADQAHGFRTLAARGPQTGKNHRVASQGRQDAGKRGSWRAERTV